jgi:hypothetical protein
MSGNIKEIRVNFKPDIYYDFAVSSEDHEGFYFTIGAGVPPGAIQKISIEDAINIAHVRLVDLINRWIEVGWIVVEVEQE